VPNVATSVSSLAAAVSERRLVGDGSALVRGIAYDSRLVEPGFLFAALPGAHADGHEFAASAVDRGAAALLVERELPLATTQIVVPDSRAALAAVATAFYRDPSRELGVIGITGTDGKTTVSFLVDAILRAAGLATGLIGTVAIRVGDDEDFHTTRQTTPESADIQRLFRRMVDRGIEWATVEATVAWVGDAPPGRDSIPGRRGHQRHPRAPRLPRQRRALPAGEGDSLRARRRRGRYRRR
jgi:UDP-N-acetylmuramoyl-L-alanyl-D-glutamate--2,6-diaminopimelate ligase